MVQRFLTVYTERCKYKHGMAFMQFRKMLPDAKLTDLMEVFKERKNLLLKIMKKIAKLVNRKLKQEPRETIEDNLPDDDLNAPEKGNEKEKAKQIDGGTNLLIRMGLDRENTIDTFEELGMTNPFDTKKSFQDALSEVRTFDFYTEVYPNLGMNHVMSIMSSDVTIEPPKCIFLPSRRLTRLMIRAMIRFS